MPKDHNTKLDQIDPAPGIPSTNIIGNIALAATAAVAGLNMLRGGVQKPLHGNLRNKDLNLTQPTEPAKTSLLSPEMQKIINASPEELNKMTQIGEKLSSTEETKTTTAKNKRTKRKKLGIRKNKLLLNAEKMIINTANKMIKKGKRMKRQAARGGL